MSTTDDNSTAQEPEQPEQPNGKGGKRRGAQEGTQGLATEAVNPTTEEEPFDLPRDDEEPSTDETPPESVDPLQSSRMDSVARPQSPTGDPADRPRTPSDVPFVDLNDMDEFAAFDAGNTPFVISGVTTKIKAGEYSTFHEEITIGGQKMGFDVRVKFVRPRISSISLRETEASTISGRKDANFVIVAHRQLEVNVPDLGWVPAQTIFYTILRDKARGLKMSDDQLALYFGHYGFQPNEELPMYLQHLGSNVDEYERIARQFKELGADENTDQVRSRQNKVRVISSFRHRGDGIPVASMEIGTVDRSQARVNPNSGFIGFLEAYWNTFRQILAFDVERSALRKVLQAEPTNAEAAAREAVIRNTFSSPRFRRPFRNWGGTNKVTDELTGAVAFYPQSVPCGRLSIVTSDGMEHPWSVWRTGMGRTTEEDTVVQIDSSRLAAAFDAAGFADTPL